jgi:hypothetical protein
VNADPLADARAEGLRVAVADLGAWGSIKLLSEYDRSARTIRISVAALASARRRGAADRFFRAAVAHELYHHFVAERQLPQARGWMAGECAAERFALERYGLHTAGALELT